MYCTLDNDPKGLVHYVTFASMCMSMSVHVHWYWWNSHRLVFNTGKPSVRAANNYVRASFSLSTRTFEFGSAIVVAALITAWSWDESGHNCRSNHLAHKALIERNLCPSRSPSRKIKGTKCGNFIHLLIWRSSLECQLWIQIGFLLRPVRVWIHWSYELFEWEYVGASSVSSSVETKNRSSPHLLHSLTEPYLFGLGGSHSGSSLR